MAKRPPSEVDIEEPSTTPPTNGKRIKADDQVAQDAEWAAFQELVAEPAPSASAKESEDRADIELADDDTSEYEEDDEDFETYDSEDEKHQRRLDNLAKQREYLLTLRQQSAHPES